MMKSPKWMRIFLGEIDGNVNPGNLEPTGMSHGMRLGHGFSNEKMVMDYWNAPCG